MAGSKVPTDPNMTPEVRRFLDDRVREISTLQTDLDAAVAALPAKATTGEGAAGTNDAKYTTPLVVAAAITALNPFGAALFHVREEETAGTDGGDFNSGSWVQRNLNTTKVNQITGASIATSSITLPIGIYHIRAKAPAYRVSDHQARLYDTTAAAVILYGTSASTLGGAGGDVTISFVEGTFTLSVQSVVRVEHQCLVTKALNGLGKSCGFGTEVYADCMIWKVS